jgi:hypothetical protein
MQDNSIDSPDALPLKLQGKNAIYHERVTLLIEILAVSETNGFFRFEARVLKPLNQAHAEKSGLYKKLLQKESFEFGAKYPQAGEMMLTHFEKFKIWGPYCPFTLWFDPDLVKLVENSADEETKRIAYELLWRG